MITKVGYNVDKLMKLFPCYRLKQIETISESEENYDQGNVWYISYPEITQVKNWYGCFSTSQTVYSEQGEEAHAQSKNVNRDDISLLRINELIQISPALKFITRDYVEMTQELIDWINMYAYTDGEDINKILDDAQKEFEIDEITTFKGCCTPSSNGNYWSYCTTQDLQLSGVEKKIMLDSINDELLRKKLECIFKCYGQTRYK